MQMVPFEAPAEDQGGSSQQSPTQQGGQAPQRGTKPPHTTVTALKLENEGTFVMNNQ